MYRGPGGSPRGSPPSASRPFNSQTQALRLRQNSDPWMPVQVIHNGSSPQQVPRTSPAIVPKGSGSSRKSKTRSHSFNLPASRPLIREVETRQENGKFEYTDCFHSKKGQEVLCDMWESQELCDVTLRVKGREFKAHKTVLASSSPYFRAMFTCGLSECKQSTIDLDAISSPTVMECILRYFYSSKFTIESDLVQDVIPAADVLQVIALKDACAEYLLRQLSVGNCLGVYAFADIHNCHKLKEEALRLIQRNFPELILTNEYKQLSYDHVLNLVSLDHLAVSSEGRVYDAVICWVKHNIKERRQYLKDLLLQVRLPLLPNEIIFDHVYKEPLIKDDQECCQILMNALQLKCLPERASSSTAKVMVTPRKRPGNSVQVVAVFGGMGRAEPCTSAEFYVHTVNQWQSLPSMRLPRWGSGVAVMGGEVYIAGGSDNHSRLYSVERFDTLSLQWSAAPHMNVPRNGVGLIAHKGYLYVLGGFDGQNPLMTAERYSPISGHWTRVANMTERRYGVGVGVMDDVIYVIGGTDTSDLKTAECYDTESDTWCQITPMNKARKYPGVVVMGGRVFAFGGCDGLITHSSVEVYDPSMEQWVYASAMATPRSGMGVAPLDGYIYVMGGSHNGAPLCSVERYDPLGDKWQSVAPMGTARDRTCATVLEVQKVDILHQKTSPRMIPHQHHAHFRQYSS